MRTDTDSTRTNWQKLSRISQKRAPLHKLQEISWSTKVIPQAVRRLTEPQRLLYIIHQFNSEDDNNYAVFIIEDPLLMLSAESIVRYSSLFLDREFNVGDDEIVFHSERSFIRRVLNMRSSSCRSYHHLNPLRGEVWIQLLWTFEYWWRWQYWWHGERW